MQSYHAYAYYCLRFTKLCTVLIFNILSGITVQQTYKTQRPIPMNKTPVEANKSMEVSLISVEHEYLNRTPDEIISVHPHLELEQVHDALSYYYENRKEFNEKIKKGQAVRPGAFKEPMDGIDNITPHQYLRRRKRQHRHSSTRKRKSSIVTGESFSARCLYSIPSLTLSGVFDD